MHYRVLYVTGATGTRYEAHLSYTLPLMQKHLGKENVRVISLGSGNDAFFDRLKLPLDTDIRRNYDRVVWIDSDVEIVRPEFAEFGLLDIPGKEAWGCLDTDDRGRDTSVSNARRAVEQSERLLGRPACAGKAYINAGVTCFDLSIINPEDWKRRLDLWRCDKFFYLDQDTLYCMCDLGVAPRRFNVFWYYRDKVRDACAIHYPGSPAKRVLDEKSGYKEGVA